VHFELGAGFCNKRAIPVVADGVTFQSLGAPLNLLQARSFEESGLKAVARDVATLAGLRTPSRFPGLEDLVSASQEFLLQRAAARQSETAKRATDRTPIQPRRGANSELPLDTSLSLLSDKIEKRGRELLVRDILPRSAAFEIPKEADLRQMSLSDLVRLAKTIGVELPFGLSMSLMLHPTGLPSDDEPTWKKVNARKSLEDIWRQLDDYEAQLKHDPKEAG
jgi:hypothetical protein